MSAARHIELVATVTARPSHSQSTAKSRSSASIAESFFSKAGKSALSQLWALYMMAICL